MIKYLALAMALCGCAILPAENQRHADHWETLFDGSDLTHWTGLGRPDIPAGHWIIEDGSLRKVAAAHAPAIAGNPPGYGGDLRTVRKYQNFELCFEFRLTQGANSGVKYNVSEELSARHGHAGAAIGFEFQILDDAHHPDANKGYAGNRTLASLYDIYPASSNKPVVRSGEWHSGCVLADGNRITHQLDKRKVLEIDTRSTDFSSHLASSKFADIENFAIRRAGYIVLQDHFDEVWYRNIRIRILDQPNS